MGSNKYDSHYISYKLNVLLKDAKFIVNKQKIKKDCSRE